MFINVDYDKRKKGYKINLAKPNQQTIASISEAYGTNYSIKLGNINEVAFNVPYFIDKLDERVKNENIELIKEKMYAKISYNNNDEWMIIDSIEDVGSGDEKYMAVTAFTNVYETSNRKISELNLEVVNPEEYYDAVLNDVAWSIGGIDPLFKDIYRSVELSNVTVLEAIITGAETFGAVLDFDTENKKINLIDIDSKAKYRGLNINYSNFLQSINRKRSVDEMTTRLYVYGSENLSIEKVNPTGMRYLEDFTYFLYPFERDENKNVIKSSHYMSDELAHAVLDKNELSKKYQPQIQAMQEEIDEEAIEYINETTLLNELRFDEMSVSGLLDIAKATGDNKLILQRQGELAEIKTKISIKELTVDHIDAIIEDLERQISQLQSQISVTSFSEELYDELSMYIIESEFRDDRYIDEEELYRDALKKFEEAKSPSVVIEASIDNIIDSLEEDYYSDKVVLGDIARVTDKEMSVEMKSLIVELSFDLDNNTCDITIANGDIEKDGYDRILSVLYDTQSTTSMLENNKHKWDTVTDVRSEVDLMRNGEIDATRNRIKAGFRESVSIEDRGIILSNPDFPNEVVIMQAGVIALSTDGGENWSTSITPRGVVAETIIGKLVASNNLIVTNDSGSFRIDGDGLTVDMDNIKIMSGEGDTPENIVDSWNKMLITMDEFADDGKLNEYEKNQIARQWDSIVMSHSSMVKVIQDAYGPETPENQYPVEYEEYMESYEELRGYLNDEIQSDGHTILDPLHRGETTDIDSDKYNRLVSDYEVNKDRFQTVIPLEFSQTYIDQTREYISLNYVENGELVNEINLSEEGIRIDGRLLRINSETEFNDDLVMNAGLIRSADGAINIDLNTGVINLARPLTINAVPVATEEDLKGIGINDKTEILTGTEIYTDKADDSVVHVEIDGKSVQEGEPRPDHPIEIYSLNDFDVVSSVSSADERNLILNSNLVSILPNNIGQGTATLMRDESTPYYRVVGDSIISTYSFDGSATSSRFSEPMIDGATYTVSVDVRAPRTGTVSFASNRGSQSILRANEWVRIKHTYTYSGTSYRVIGLMYDSAIIDYKNWKIEKGSKATDWTPAPEDIIEGDSYPLIDKINLSLSEPLRSVGDAKDRLFRDSDGLWKIERNISEHLIEGTENWDTGNYRSGGFNHAYFYPKNFNYGEIKSNILSSELEIGYEELDNSTLDSLSSHIYGAIPMAIEGATLSGGGVSDLKESIISTTVISFNLSDERTGISENDTKKDRVDKIINVLLDQRVVVLYEKQNPDIETLDQEFQDKLNNLHSFQDSNYVYTVINDKTDIISERLKPTLHATFKGGGWYSRRKTEDEFEKQREEIREELEDFVTVEKNNEELGKITTSLNDYLALVEQTKNSVHGLFDEDGNLVLNEEGKPIQAGIVAEVEKMFERAVAIEREMGGLRDTWNFDVTQITMAEEGLFVGTKDSTMGILIAPDRIVEGRFIPAGIYFMDGGQTIAFISGQMMQINRGIFVQSAQIGEHQIETISGGHTIFSWIPK